MNTNNEDLKLMSSKDLILAEGRALEWLPNGNAAEIMEVESEGSSNMPVPLDTQPQKRGPDRPRKVVRKGGAPQPAGAKRGPGRPRKVVVEEAAPHSRPAGRKQGPRRPRKVVPTPPVVAGPAMAPTLSTAADPVVVPALHVAAAPLVPVVPPLPVAARRLVIPPLPIAGVATAEPQRSPGQLPGNDARRTTKSGVAKQRHGRRRKVDIVHTSSFSTTPYATVQEGLRGRPLKTVVRSQSSGSSFSMDGTGSGTLVLLEFSSGLVAEMRTQGRPRKKPVPKRDVQWTDEMHCSSSASPSSG